LTHRGMHSEVYLEPLLIVNGLAASSMSSDH
jgi:hypothetical protein